MYQSLGRGVETDGFAALNERSALQVVASRLVHSDALEPGDLRKCRADTDDWVGAVELAFDQKRFDLLEAIVSELIRRKIDVKPWLLIVQTMFRRQEFLRMNDPVEKLGACYVRIQQNLVSTLYEVIQVRSARDRPDPGRPPQEVHHLLPQHGVAVPHQPLLRAAYARPF